MERPRNETRTLGEHFLHALREHRARRPSSFYFLLLIPVVLIVAAPVFYTKDHPKQFALHLILIFVFVFVILLRAVIDVFEIVRRHLRERQQAFRTSFSGDGPAPQETARPENLDEPH